MTGHLVLHAPNVHTGGGLVLLRALLAAWPSGEPLRAWLDARARHALTLPATAQVEWVAASAPSRLTAERGLARSCAPGDTVLCFHGLPPLLPLRAGVRVVVFLQNRNYLGVTPLSAFSLRTAVRLAFERAVGRAFRHRVGLYVVQTATMARDLARWQGAAGGAAVVVSPFTDPMPGMPPVPPGSGATPEWDFVYVSDGEAHKNHRRLFEAWQALAAEGLRPRLAVTLGPRDAELATAADALRARHGVEIHNLGHLPHDGVLQLYGRARALIFPSLSESFGLPLIEARQLGLPILAPELDYVRDVCAPVQTFDPLSPVSIARAVRRFLGVDEPPRAPGTAADFLALVRGDATAGDTRA